MLTRAPIEEQVQTAVLPRGSVKAKGGCTTTTIALSIGSRKDPGVKERIAMFQQWLRTWSEMNWATKARTKMI